MILATATCLFFHSLDLCLSLALAPKTMVATGALIAVFTVVGLLGALLLVHLLYRAGRLSAAALRARASKKSTSDTADSAPRAGWWPFGRSSLRHQVVCCRVATRAELAHKGQPRPI